ncbi:MAG TPA: hypothetical protein VMC86_04595, partial [Gemmatimonadales bacterium]|nr:hypothetical protein [Gemmatimonadales bacterium]
MRIEWLVIGAAVVAAPAGAQQPDTLRRDSLRLDTLPGITVSATRADRPLSRTAAAVATVTRADISTARPTWGLDEALNGIPGVLDANRY